MKITELAKKYNVTGEELIKLLKNAGYDVNARTSAVDYDMLTALDRHFAWSNTPTKKTRARAAAKTRAKKAVAVADEAENKAKAKVKAKTKLVRKGTAKKTEAPVVEVAAKAKSKVKVKTKAAAPVIKEVEARKETVKAKATTKAKAKSKVAGKAAAEKKVPEVEKPAVPAREAREKKPEQEIYKDPDLERARQARTKGKVARIELPPVVAPEPDRRERAQQKAVRESVRRTLAKIETTRKTRRSKKRPEIGDVDLPAVRVQEKSNVAMMASALGTTTAEIVEQLLELGVEAVATTELDRDTMEMIGSEFGRVLEIEAVYGEKKLREDAQVDPAKLQPRSPVVTVMGHVDHGKTSILDKLRKSNVAAGEAGGITQHIGAYEVEIPNGRITFIDTPGHEAFTAMRSRGASITDIVVLVVAADDGVMPQTAEAINHTRVAGVPMIVAVNKCDLPGANPASVKQQLIQNGVIVEEFGGEVIAVDVSAKTGQGLDKLLEMILLQAEVLELKADPTARAQGVVVEVKKEEGRGILVTVLVRQGTLRVGDVLVMGDEYGKVRSLVDYRGKTVKEAPPSTPVQVLGASGLPEPGDAIIAVKNEREAREISEKRLETTRMKSLTQVKAVTLEDLYQQIQLGDVKELNLIIKGDTNGSVEALRESLSPMEVHEIKVKVLHSAVGVVTESDVMLASGSGATIIAFSTKVPPKVKELAERKGVDIRLYTIIYEVIQDVEKAMQGLLEPVFVERVLGRAEVRALFRVSKLGTIAGTMVVNGVIQRSANARVLRSAEKIFDGKIASLKRFQDDVREVAENFECGISLSGFDALEEKDIIEAYVVEEKARAF